MTKTEIEKFLLIEKIIESIGDSPYREGLKDTPNRVKSMWNEVFEGYNLSKKPTLTFFDNGKDGIKYDEIVCDEGMFYSHCEHHIVPFFGKYYFGYIPGKKVVGLSKIARLVKWHASRLQVQERLTKDIVDDVWQQLKPRGVILVLKGRHLCKEMRGIKQQGEMITSQVRGLFKDKFGVKQEFFNLIGL